MWNISFTSWSIITTFTGYCSWTTCPCRTSSWYSTWWFFTINFYCLISWTSCTISSIVRNSSTISCSCCSSICNTVVLVCCSIICIWNIAFTSRSTCITTFTSYCSWTTCPCRASSWYGTWWFFTINFYCLICCTWCTVSNIVIYRSTFASSCCSSICNTVVLICCSIICIWNITFTSWAIIATFTGYRSWTICPCTASTWYRTWWFFTVNLNCLICCTWCTVSSFIINFSAFSCSVWAGIGNTVVFTCCSFICIRNITLTSRTTCITTFTGYRSWTTRPCRTSTWNGTWWFC